MILSFLNIGANCELVTNIMSIIFTTKRITFY